MTTLWIGNIAPGTSDDELKALLVKYGFPAFDGIEHIPGDGSRPAVMLTFYQTDAMQLQQLQAEGPHDVAEVSRAVRAGPQVAPQAA